MKVKSYRNPVKSDTLLLDLVEEADGVRLIAVSPKGSPILCGSLLRISSLGELELSINVNTELGLKLDSNGTLKVF